ncbi:MAG: MobA/MobL family protein [Alphaproteobacteria bacterium]|nr:MobA/MobL family protein [Alphaproteobacteria bacterium]MBU1837104.1 MobA/MobL family protein [Alphaproteobacteria bacterium]
MAIYSLNLASIGKTTHAAGTAGAHLRYIGRPDARPEIEAAHMPLDPTEARTWMDQAERADRKNARVLDKVRLALPRELTPEQRAQLVHDFAEGLTKGRVPWFAATHASGKDAANPHCHLVIRDRDIETGKRVMRLSDSPRDRQKAGLEPKAVEWVRARWEHCANAALERAGHDVRIDRRSLEAQGVAREPTIHIGPQAVHVEEHVKRPESRPRTTGTGRVIDYPAIDQGRTRQERHAEIVDLNIERDARSGDFSTRERAKALREQIAKDRALEARLAREAQARTREARAQAAQEAAARKETRQQRSREQAAARASLAQEWRTRRTALAERHHGERKALAEAHGTVAARVLRVVDVTGRTKKRQGEERAQLRAAQADDRLGFAFDHRERRDGMLEAISERHKIIEAEIRAAHDPAKREMRDRHAQAEREADQQRQARAAERERAERIVEQTIKRIELMTRSRSRGRGFGLER